MQDRDFQRLRALIHEITGIHLNDTKRALVEGRLGKRLRSHGLASFAEYVELVLADPGERRQLINCITTNKTDFFREAHHFELLRTRVFPELRARAQRGAPRRLRLLSAGCSTGEEPYSLAMTVRDHLLAADRAWDVRILAGDIDTEALERASRGVYLEERLAPLSPEQRRRHFLRGTGGCAGSWRVRPELRELVEFERLNLVGGRWPFPEPFDAIFCRNVVIYFDQPTQRRIFEGFARHLHPDGYLFVGHSESMLGVSDAFTLVGPTVHRPQGPAQRRLQLGEVHASRTPARISTVLGSCVGATLFDPVTRIGGMNHFLLPSGAGARYGVEAMESLIARIVELGGERSRLEARVAGANHVVEDLDGSVALANASFVREYLRDRRIPLLGERIGGKRALEVQFQTESGRLRAREVSA